MDKLILFLLIIVLILCFKNINVMVKKSDEDVMKVIIILIIVGLLFMCKDDLVEGVDNELIPECQGINSCGKNDMYCLDTNANVCNTNTSSKCIDAGMVWCKVEDEPKVDPSAESPTDPSAESPNDPPADIEPPVDNPTTDRTLIYNNEPFIKGICYTMPTMYVNGSIAPDNIKTDVAADKLWSNARSRGDLDILKNSGVTHLRVYDWDLNADHTNF